MRERYAAAGDRRARTPSARPVRLGQIAPHGPADRPLPVAESLVDPPHRLVPDLGPRHDLADAVRGCPRELALLQGSREAAAAPATVDDRQPVLGAGRIVGPGKQTRVSDDDPVLERD